MHWDTVCVIIWNKIIISANVRWLMIKDGIGWQLHYILKRYNFIYSMGEMLDAIIVEII